mmetsp:Transcript_54730/g.177829  ORF Transcript_54730/g.177829 Transcript_54730/m.177829 type:complete len:214 (-) Transcript_54730:826-1467(-)
MISTEDAQRRQTCDGPDSSRQAAQQSLLPPTHWPGVGTTWVKGPQPRAIVDDFHNQEDSASRRRQCNELLISQSAWVPEVRQRKHPEGAAKGKEPRGRERRICNFDGIFPHVRRQLLESILKHLEGCLSVHCSGSHCRTTTPLCIFYLKRLQRFHEVCLMVAARHPDSIPLVKGLAEDGTQAGHLRRARRGCVCQSNIDRLPGHCVVLLVQAR